MIKFTSLVEFCEQYGYDGRIISGLLRGKLLTYKGWHLPQTDTDFIWRKQKVHVYESRDGKIHHVKNIKRFAKEQGVSPNTFYFLNSGMYSESHGFKIPGTNPRVRHRYGKENGNKRYEYIIFERDGQEYKVVDDILDFCAEQNVSKSDLYAILGHRQKTVHGLSIKAVKFSPKFIEKLPFLPNEEIKFSYFGRDITDYKNASLIFCNSNKKIEVSKSTLASCYISFPKEIKKVLDGQTETIGDFRVCLADSVVTI